MSVRNLFNNTISSKLNKFSVIFSSFTNNSFSFILLDGSFLPALWQSYAIATKIWRLFNCSRNKQSTSGKSSHISFYARCYELFVLQFWSIDKVSDVYSLSRIQYSGSYNFLFYSLDPTVTCNIVINSISNLRFCYKRKATITTLTRKLDQLWS